MVLNYIIKLLVSDETEPSLSQRIFFYVISSHKSDNPCSKYLDFKFDWDIMDIKY